MGKRNANRRRDANGGFAAKQNGAFAANGAFAEAPFCSVKEFTSALRNASIQIECLQIWKLGLHFVTYGAL